MECRLSPQPGPPTHPFGVSRFCQKVAGNPKVYRALLHRFCGNSTEGSGTPVTLLRKLFCIASLVVARHIRTPCPRSAEGGQERPVSDQLMNHQMGSLTKRKQASTGAVRVQVWGVGPSR
jgi:hypothetical protein